jgi:putative nucleotidyltransferase with HDIG domain
VAGLELASDLGLTAGVLPELEAMRGIEQNPFHHLDVHDHTLAVLEATIELERDPVAVFGAEHGEAIRALLREPFADELPRSAVLRFGALLHDVAKPATRGVTTEGRITFIGHDQLGAKVARAVMRRLRASERLAAHVGALARHHLRLGFLVHREPLSRRDLHTYLAATGEVAADVTLLSVADRLATRGANAAAAIERHLALAREVIGEALRWQQQGPPPPLLRGDHLVRELALEPGPQVGELLAALQAAQFAGEVGGPQEALAYARSLIAEGK